MIVVTGGMGFIGSRLVHRLNQQGFDDILVVDTLEQGHKFYNLATAQISDYLDADNFLNKIQKNTLPKIDVIFHQGACSTTTEWNGKYMMNNNYEYSKQLLDYCQKQNIPFIYASSAATYGKRTENFSETCGDEEPLNVYGYSKLLFDRYITRALPHVNSQVVGLRYFNVYGPHEGHKGRMASVAFHLYQQFKRGETLKLFAGSHGYGDGEHCRDFIYVDDACDLNIWCWQQPHINGIYNCGTGQARSFLSLAKAMVTHFGTAQIDFIPMPQDLRPNYQSFTQADLKCLRACGYTAEFTGLETGIKNYMHWLDTHQDWYA